MTSSPSSLKGFGISKPKPKDMNIKNRLAEIQVRYSTKIKKEDRVQVKSSEDAFRVLIEIFDQTTLEYQEIFYVLLLNRANEVLGYKCVSKGGISGTVVDTRQILGLALKCNAVSIILSHNHPSGNKLPSQTDIDLTKKIKDGGALLDIMVLDHLIVTMEGYYSLADEGII